MDVRVCVRACVRASVRVSRVNEACLSRCAGTISAVWRGISSSSGTRHQGYTEGAPDG